MTKEEFISKYEVYLPYKNDMKNDLEKVLDQAREQGYKDGQSDAHSSFQDEITYRGWR